MALTNRQMDTLCMAIMTPIIDEVERLYQKKIKSPEFKGMIEFLNQLEWIIALRKNVKETKRIQKTVEVMNIRHKNLIEPMLTSIGQGGYYWNPGNYSGVTNSVDDLVFSIAKQKLGINKDGFIANVRSDVYQKIVLSDMKDTSAMIKEITNQLKLKLNDKIWKS